MHSETTLLGRCVCAWSQHQYIASEVFRKLRWKKSILNINDHTSPIGDKVVETFLEASCCFFFLPPAVTGMDGGTCKYDAPLEDNLLEATMVERFPFQQENNQIKSDRLVSLDRNLFFLTKLNNKPNYTGPYTYIESFKSKHIQNSPVKAMKNILNLVDTMWQNAGKNLKLKDMKTNLQLNLKKASFVLLM